MSATASIPAVQDVRCLTLSSFLNKIMYWPAVQDFPMPHLSYRQSPITRPALTCVAHGTVSAAVLSVQLPQWAWPPPTLAASCHANRSHLCFRGASDGQMGWNATDRADRASPQPRRRHPIAIRKPSMHAVYVCRLARRTMIGTAHMLHRSYNQRGAPPRKLPVCQV